jgi:acid phosphatase type 7
VKATFARVLLLAVVLWTVSGGIAFAASLVLSSNRLTVFASCTLRAATADTYVNQASTGTNYGTATTFFVRSQNLNRNQRAFVRFDLASCFIPATAEVITARLSLHMSTAPTANRTYQARRVTASWTETGITWANQAAVAGSATSTTTTGTVSGVRLEWDVAADVSSFVNGSLVNNGWRIADSAESSAAARTATFSSDEHGTASQRPRLTITYYP